MTEDEIFTLADYIIGGRYNRGKIKAFADAVYGRGIKDGAEAIHQVYGAKLNSLKNEPEKRVSVNPVNAKQISEDDDEL